MKKKHNPFVRFWIEFYRLFRAALKEFQKDKATKLSASLSYYTLFSLAPMIILIIATTSIWFGKEAIEGYLYKQFDGLLGSAGSIQLQEMISNVKISGDTPWLTAIGLVTLFFGATGVFIEIQDSINTIWSIKSKPRRSWVKFVLNRLLSFSTIIAVGFLLLVSLAFSAVISALNDRLFSAFADSAWWIFIITNLITFIAVLGLFGFIYKVLPDATLAWRDVAAGAMLSSFLFLIGKYFINLYLSNSNTITAFGAAGALVLIILWVYYSSIILFFGAEFTKVFANEYGGKIHPSPFAVFVKKEEVETNKPLNLDTNDPVKEPKT
ncbi:MAG: YihY/virulence factor BrkB family protein [Saprospiraceae bacterium]